MQQANRRNRFFVKVNAFDGPDTVLVHVTNGCDIIMIRASAYSMFIAEVPVLLSHMTRECVGCRPESTHPAQAECSVNSTWQARSAKVCKYSIRIYSSRALSQACLSIDSLQDPCVIRFITTAVIWGIGRSRWRWWGCC